VIPRRLLLACILASAFGAAVTVSVVSGFLAALAALEPWAGLPGAVALIALALAACLALPAALIAPRRSRKRQISDAASGPEFLARLWMRIKERPLLTSGLGGLAILLVLFNPRYLGAILRAYLHEQTARRRP
jgi:hypothetical protein